MRIGTRAGAWLIAALVSAAVAAPALAARQGAAKDFGWPRVEKGFKRIYNGSNTADWKQAGPGSFVLEADGSLRSTGGMGLLWYSLESYKDFVLRVDWKVEKADANSGVFVRFPDPQGDPWKPVNQGYEIQIGDTGEAKHRTGAVYSFSEAAVPPTKPVGQWNTMEIEVVGQRYTVRVNGTNVTTYTGDRSLHGYVGLQNHGDGDKVWFRNIRVKTLGAKARGKY